MSVIEPKIETIKIDSGKIIPVDQCFKVVAGPGAGKTYWLIQHCKRILRTSSRLGRTGKIGCITYTNAATDELISRFGCSTDRIDVSTIHSFLYRNILKPFAFLLKEDDEFNPNNMNGHEDNIPHGGLISSWKSATKQYYLNDDVAIQKCLGSLDWQFSSSNTLTIIQPAIWKSKIKTKNGKSLNIRRDSFYEYKKLCWKKGIMHHEDVLYFSYKLIQKNPRIIDFVKSRFPYIFIDEFQDTHPIQTKVIEEIGSNGVYIGVIGDPAQSIYKFQGSCREDFVDFMMPDMQHYEIASNRRSTNEIIDTLTKFRTDGLQQFPVRNVSGETVKLLIGDYFKCLKYIEDSCGNYVALARNNALVRQLQYGLANIATNPWPNIFSLDGDVERTGLIRRLIESFIALDNQDYHQALKIKSVFRNTQYTEDVKRRLSIRLLDEIGRARKAWMGKNLVEAQNELHDYLNHNFEIKVGGKIRSGKYKKYAETKNIQDLYHGLLYENAKGRIRTIHKAKGLEFNTVALVIDSSSDVKLFLSPNTEHKDDDCRIYYVGLSRAINKLYLIIEDNDEPVVSALQRKYQLDVEFIDA